MLIFDLPFADPELDLTDIAIPPPFSPFLSSRPIPASLGDEHMYRRPPSKGKHFLLDSRCPFLTFSQPFFTLPSSCRRRTTLEPPSATLKSPPRPLAVPSILVPNFNMSRARSEPTSREWFDFLNSPVVDVEHRLVASECCQRRGDIARAPPRTLIDAAQPLRRCVYRFSSAEQGNAGIVVDVHPPPFRGCLEMCFLS